MAGYWNASRTQILDQNDNLIPGALAYFFEAGTSTPMTVYSSVTLGEANEHPHPVAADGNARWPNVFFDDVTDLDPDTEGVQSRQYYRVRVTDAGGALIYDDDSVPIIGQSTGGGGGEVPIPVDQNALAKTGDVKLKFGLAADTGWVRMNGLTIGSATSGATERANADTQNLYVYLWGNHNDTICPVTGGRGATALADYTAGAGKALALPDMRHRAPFGVGQMGNTVAPVPPRIADGYIDTVTAGAANVVGVSGGDDDIALTTAQIPAHSHGATGVPAEVGPPAVAAKAALQAADHGHPARYATTDNDPAGRDDGGLAMAHGNGIVIVNKPAYLGKVAPPPASPLLDDEVGHQIGGSGLVAITGNTSLAGGPASALTGVSDRHENMPPFMLFTYLIKL